MDLRQFPKNGKISSVAEQGKLTVLVAKLHQYLKRLGQSSRLERTAAPDGVPLFVSENNDWLRMDIGGVPHILAVSRLPELSPEDVVAQWNGLIRCGVDGILVVPPRDDVYCTCLDTKGVSYIMPGARLSVPGKMVLVTRHVRPLIRPKGRMSVHAQLVVLWHLLNAGGEKDGFAEVMEGTRLDKSHLSRAASELELLGLARIDRSWRAHAIVFEGDKKLLWKRASALMPSPVMRRIRLADVPAGLPTAGVEALSERSMLAADENPVFAVKRGDSRVDETKDSRYVGPTIEIWRYDPVLFSKDGRSVDSLSLWLTLRDEGDPRIRMALDEMMEELAW